MSEKEVTHNLRAQMALSMRLRLKEYSKRDKYRGKLRTSFKLRSRKSSKSSQQKRSRKSWIRQTTFRVALTMLR